MLLKGRERTLYVHLRRRASAFAMTEVTLVELSL